MKTNYCVRTCLPKHTHSLIIKDIFSFFFIYCLNFCSLIAHAIILSLSVSLSHLCSSFLKNPVSLFYLSTFFLSFSFTVLHITLSIHTQVNREQVQFLKTKEDCVNLYFWNSHIIFPCN